VKHESGGALMSESECHAERTSAAPAAAELQNINASTHQRINASTHQRINASTHQRINASTHQCINASTHQCIKEKKDKRYHVRTKAAIA
jgi:hypothetical protein